MYEWETSRDRRGRYTYCNQLIDVATIIGPAFIQHVFSKNSSLSKCGHPDKKDRFWYMEHRYADRTGWEDISQHARLNEEIDVVEGEHVGGIKINSSDDDDDNNDDDDAFNDNDDHDHNVFTI
jgi:hypothetical protein